MPSKFQNPWPHEEHGFGDILRWKLRLGESEDCRIIGAPDVGAAWQRLAPEAVALPPEEGWRISWLGHASFLVQGCGQNLLIDPVFSQYCSPVPIPSMKRLVEPPCSISDLPRINAVLLTHSHYDHLDLKSLRTIGFDIPLVTAEGHAGWLRKKGFKNVLDLPWQESTEIGDIKITSVPAQHFTARTPFDRNRGHWCGWVIEGGGKKLYHAGDSGYCPAFAGIGKRFGKIDFGMVPIGAYQPRSIMKPMHMNPDEAVQAFVDSRCERAVAMHWGTFRLTDEPMGEPPILLEMALKAKKLPAGCFAAGSVGKIWEV